MIAVVQRVSQAKVTVGGRLVARIGRGLLVLLGVRKGDGEEDARVLAGKIAALRIFEDAAGRMNLSALDLRLEVLVVSQFTLCADLRRGRRPGFDFAEAPESAEGLVRLFAKVLVEQGLVVEEGSFGASMDVSLVNEGPATFILDSAIWRRKSAASS
ncbi:MAG: D-tyrosyl-tRNA(Tyr) deacylase [Planctomycetes bacterium]|nr:D-tyrosyl-tRNA(Tyr) deacylase [Planctomycetota bacterium]